MASYLINGWEGVISLEEMQGYLDSGELYEDCWGLAVPNDGKGWQLVRDILAESVTTKFVVGSRVEGLYGDGTWYPGYVRAMNDDGSCLISFDGFENYPLELCERVRSLDEQADPAQPFAPTPARASSPEAVADKPAEGANVWHLLAADGISTEGPYSLAQLEVQLADSLTTPENYMIHETGIEWVTVGSKVKLSASLANTAVSPILPSALQPDNGTLSTKKFVAQQTRRRHHERKKTETIIFTTPTEGRKKHSRKKTVTTVFPTYTQMKRNPRDESLASPVKSGQTLYRVKDADEFDENAAMQICKWMETILEREVAYDADDFKRVLMKESHIYCELFNRFKPKTTRRPKKSKIRFIQLENLNSFFMACKSFLDMEDVTLFSGNDCLDGKNMNKVLSCIAEFAKRMHAEFPPDDAPPILQVKFK